MTELAAPIGPPPVPAFLMKLWTLVEDPSNSEVISWNWNGQNFCILDEQRFSKEILPKYFKHNNLSSFIRQLNMYGFRKIMSLESGLVKSERGSTIEFQHPFFKKGKSELLGNIKRKMSSVKSEETHLSQEELQNVASELQSLKHGQSNMDKKLENMRRENEALWKEVSTLRRRHSQQQKLLTKVLQFILSLMRGNIVMGTKRKRQLTLEPTQSPSPKYSRHILQCPEDVEEEALFSVQKPEASTDNTIEFQELFSPGEGTSKTSTNAVEPMQSLSITSTLVPCDAMQEVICDDSVLQLQSLADQTLIPRNAPEVEALALDVVQTNTAENPYSVINSILNEGATVSNNDMLDREEIHDFLSCIDTSLEELQSMLSVKKLNVDSDFIEELFKPDLSSSDNPGNESNTSIVSELQGDEEIVLSQTDDRLNKDKQLMQYTGGPLLSLFEMPLNNYGKVTSDPETMLDTLGDGALLPASSETRCSTVPGPNSSKEPAILVEDFSGPQEFIPIFVLSPVNKLLEEVTEAETL